jgi:hypothetical protein
MAKRIIIILITMLISFPAFAEESSSPPKWPTEVAFEPNTKRDPVGPFQLGHLKVVLEKTTLEEVKTIVGVGSIKRQGDASESIDWICYTATVPTLQRIWITSSELGGGSVVDGISAVDIEPSKSTDESCPELPSKFQPAQLSNGIWINSSDKLIRKNLGNHKIVNSILKYIYFGKQGEFDVTGAIAIRMQHGKVKEIHITHNTTN